MQFDTENVISLKRDYNFSLCCSRFATRGAKSQGYTKSNSRLFDLFLEAKDSSQVISTRGETMNKEIVKRLKKRIEYLDTWKGIRKEWHNRTIEELQKIIGER